MKPNTIFASFKNAFAGCAYFFRHERNGKIQLLMGLSALIISMLLRISRQEWIAVLLCTGVVLCAEMMNTALEKLCDQVNPAFSEQIKMVKDVAAGAVLFISIISAIIGALIFLPKIWQVL